ncbi:hypothetical protein WA158_005211 [Blastocystis sp. Blastoise]
MEAFAIWQGEPTTGAVILYVKGDDVDKNSYSTYKFCISPGKYTISLTSNSEYGWSSGSFVQIRYGSYEVLLLTLSQSNGKSYEKIFYLTTFVSFGASWKYTDIAHLDSSWQLDAYDDSLWATATGGEFPARTAITRYYRRRLVVQTLGDLLSVILVVRKASSTAIYWAGKLIFSNNLNTTDLNPLTVPNYSTETASPYLIISLNDLVFNDTPYGYISIEVHEFPRESEEYDTFDFMAISSFKSPYECTSSLLLDAAITMSPMHMCTTCQPSYLTDPYHTYEYYDADFHYPTDFLFTLPDNNTAFVNSYKMTISSDQSRGYPVSWSIYGADDSENWLLLDKEVKTDIFSREPSLYRHFSNTTINLQKIKLTIEDTSISSSFGLSTFQVYYCAYPSEADKLTYTKDSVVTYLGATFSMKPTSTNFEHYTATSLPAGISISYETGELKGTFQEVRSYQSSIVAIHNITHLETQTKIDFIVTNCSYPYFTKINVCKHNTVRSYADKLSLYDKDRTLLYEKSGYTSNKDITFDLCIPAGDMYIIIDSAQNLEWTPGNRVTISLYNSDYSSYIIGEYFYYLKGQKEFAVNLDFSIYPQAPWNYSQSVSRNDWMNQITSENFSLFEMSSSLLASQSTWYFKKEIEIISTEDYTGFLFRLYTKGGYVVYINDIEIFRDNIISGPLTVDMTIVPIVEHDRYRFFSFLGAITSLRQGHNVISIAVYNTPAIRHMPIEFDATILLMHNRGNQGYEYNIKILSSISTLQNAFSTMLNNTRTTIINLPIEGSTPLSLYISFVAPQAMALNTFCFNTLSDKALTLSQQYDKDILYVAPNSITIYGSTNNQTFTALVTLNKMTFSSSASTRCFYTSNNSPYHYYKITFNSYETSLFSNPRSILYYLYLSQENLESVEIPAFIYSRSIIEAELYTFLRSPTPPSDFNSFSISPPLPASLSLSAYTGEITGQLISFLNETVYTITAFNGFQMAARTTITIYSTSCLISKSPIVLAVKMGLNDTHTSISVKDGTFLSIYSQSYFLLNEWTNIYFCLQTGTYIFDINSKKSTAAMNIEYHVGLLDGTSILNGEIIGDSSGINIPFTIKYFLIPSVFSWSYYYSTRDPPEQWNTGDYSVTSWPTAYLEQLPLPIGVTQYYRFSYNPQAVSTDWLYLTEISSTLGIIVYLNGYEVIRCNLQQGNINRNTYAESILSSPRLCVRSIPSLYAYLVRRTPQTVAIEAHQANNIPDTSAFECYIHVIGSGVDINKYGAFQNNEGKYNMKNLVDYRQETGYLSGPKCTGTTLTWKYDEYISMSVGGYIVMVGKSCNMRHPSGWKFFGSNDEKEWILLDERTNQIFTASYQSKVYTILNLNSYVYYKLYITECKNKALVETDKEDCYFEGSLTDYGFQLQEFRLTSRAMNNICLPKDNFPLTEGPATISVSCPLYYIGNITASCSNNSWQNIKNQCTALPLTSVSYSQPIFYVTYNQSYVFIPTIPAASYTCTIEPPLTNGLIFDTTSAVIEGYVENIEDTFVHIVMCTNPSGSANTTIIFEKAVIIPSNYILYIIISSLLILIILIGCFFLYKQKIYALLGLKSRSSSSENKVMEIEMKTQIASTKDSMNASTSNKNKYKKMHDSEIYDYQSIFNNVYREIRKDPFGNPLRDTNLSSVISSSTPTSSLAPPPSTSTFTSNGKSKLKDSKNNIPSKSMHNDSSLIISNKQQISKHISQDHRHHPLNLSDDDEAYDASQSEMTESTCSSVYVTTPPKYAQNFLSHIQSTPSSDQDLLSSSTPVYQQNSNTSITNDIKPVSNPLMTYHRYINEYRDHTTTQLKDLNNISKHTPKIFHSTQKALYTHKSIPEDQEEDSTIQTTYKEPISHLQSSYIETNDSHRTSIKSPSLSNSIRSPSLSNPLSSPVLSNSIQSPSLSLDYTRNHSIPTPTESSVATTKVSLSTPKVTSIPQIPPFSSVPTTPPTTTDIPIVCVNTSPSTTSLPLFSSRVSLTSIPSSQKSDISFTSPQTIYQKANINITSPSHIRSTSINQTIKNTSTASSPLISEPSKPSSYHSHMWNTPFSPSHPFLNPGSISNRTSSTVSASPSTPVSTHSINSQRSTQISQLKDTTTKQISILRNNKEKNSKDIPNDISKGIPNDIPKDIPRFVPMTTFYQSPMNSQYSSLSPTSDTNSSASQHPSISS